MVITTPKILPYMTFTEKRLDPRITLNVVNEVSCAAIPEVAVAVKDASVPLRVLNAM